MVEHDFFSENNSQLGVFWLRRGLQANHITVQKVHYSRNPSIKNSFNEAILLMSINEALLSR